MNAALSARRVKSLLSPVVAVVVALVHRPGPLAGGGTHPRRNDDGRVADGLSRVSGQVLQAGARPGEDDQCRRADQRRTRADSIHPRYRHEHPGTAGRARARRHSQGAIAFEHVAFSYNPEVPVLQDVTFSIAPGQFVGVVGADGKREVDHRQPDSAFLRCDGRPHPDRRHRHPRVHASRVSAARSGSCCRTPCSSAGRCARTSPMGVTTPPTRRSSPPRSSPTPTSSSSGCPTATTRRSANEGITLSGGQRQRIGIARAFIRNAPILILDEPTASLDTESEQLVMEGLDRLMKGRTVIMITHRLNTIRGADTIIVLHERDRGGTRHARRSAGTRRDLRRLVPDQAGRARRISRYRGPRNCRERSSHGAHADCAPRRLRQADPGRHRSASRTLRVKMFVFSDPALLKAVIAAKRRGVNVRVMLNPARRSGEHDNEATRKALERAGHRRERRQSGLRPHAREVDGRGR